MAGTSISSTGKMTQVAKNVEEIIGRYNQSITRLYDIGQELDNMWDGEASNTFKSRLAADRDRFMALSKMLTQYVATLNQDVQIYHKAEADAIETIKTRKTR